MKSICSTAHQRLPKIACSTLTAWRWASRSVSVTDPYVMGDGITRWTARAYLHLPTAVSWPVYTVDPELKADYNHRSRHHWKMSGILLQIAYHYLHNCRRNVQWSRPNSLTTFCCTLSFLVVILRLLRRNLSRCHRLVISYRIFWYKQHTTSIAKNSP